MKTSLPKQTSSGESSGESSGKSMMQESDLARAIHALRTGARRLRSLEAAIKNQTLLTLAEKIHASTTAILRANQLDLDQLSGSTPPAFRDRLTLNPARIDSMCESLRQVAQLPDPVGEVVETRSLANGLKLRRVRAPLGVILMIFESRPNVILEAFSLAYKSGNVIALRGGSDSQHTAKVLYQIIHESIGASSTHFVFGFTDYNRAHVRFLLSRPDLVDIVVPRGGEKLIAFVQEHARMPIIKNDRGLCHAYVDDSADLEMAVEIVINAKTQRPGVCNSLETVLIQKSVANRFFERFIHRFNKPASSRPPHLEIRACAVAFTLISQIVNSAANSVSNSIANEAPGRRQRDSELNSGGLKIVPASETDWNTEHLDLILNARVVDDLDQAISFIERHSSKHSETIITADENKARRFQNEIDSAAVYWNASTRFTDGFEFGLGGELGISTQKLHVRGPVGLRELTTPRWLIDGSGQTRK